MSDERPGPEDESASGNAEDSQHGVLDGIIAAWQQAKDAFANSERRYHNLVEQSLGLICTHDLTGRLQSINPAAARSLGYEPEHGVGHNLAEFLAPETRHLFGDYLQRIRENGQDAGLMRVIASDGRERVWMYHNVLSEEPGTQPYVLGHAIDITERIVAERTLREKEQALRRAHDELERRVTERTIALEQANERLRVEIAERQRAEEQRERALIEQRDTLAFRRLGIGGARTRSKVRATPRCHADVARAVRSGLDDGSRVDGGRQDSLRARHSSRPAARSQPGQPRGGSLWLVASRLSHRSRLCHGTADDRHPHGRSPQRNSSE